ncbi:trichohyalin-like isoform X2 [Anneissia japonica]|uniref:trichohyalin-like isoform X2 n=1 Tax=Anneissia japonica TaxID=1529436 RepID=UPI0014254FAC|nr:trichohyalin-like isoform X2 [Anneissia japonica]
MAEEALQFFDLLDPTQNGYITTQDVQRFDESIHSSPIFPEHVPAAVQAVCGAMSGGLCTRTHFLPVLLELERRRIVEEQALWDFKALDRDGCDVISIKDALFLFKATHQEKFSMNTWNKFLETRESLKDNVCFDEVRMWLCNIPDGPPCKDSIVINECNKLETQKIEEEFENHKQFLAFQELDEQIRALQAREKQEYREKFRRGARRKLQRWNHLGLEAMLFDDGMDWDDFNRNNRNRVSVTELMQAIDLKYNYLKEKLLWELIRKQTGEMLWSTMSESEHEEHVLQVQLRVNEYIRQGVDEKILGLEIASHSYPSKLEALIGYTQDKHALYLENQKQTTSMLQADGKTEQEIYISFAKKYAESIQGETTGGQLLIDLYRRYQYEKEYLLSVLKEVGNQTLTSREMITTYAHLKLQFYMMTLEESFQYCAISVGLCERPQEFKATSFDYDRDLQEILALQRLNERKGKKIKRLEDKWSGNEDKGIVDLQTDLLNEMAKKHFVEREILIFLLQGRDSNNAKAIARNKNKDIRDSCLKQLRGQRENWRKGSSEYRVSKRSIHMKLLQEGVGLYFENRREEVKGHNLDDTHLAAVVLADLQQQQCREVHQLIMEMYHKDASELQGLIKKEAKSRIEEWLDNISMVILGSFELTPEEQEIIRALEEKYDVLRDKLLMEALINQYGVAEWNKKTVEEQQRLLVKKRLEERRLRQDGKMDELNRLIGDAANREKNLLSMMGKNREEYEKKLRQRLLRREKRQAQGLESEDESEDELDMNEDKSSGNIMKDIQLRFDDELDALMRQLRGQHGNYLSEQERQALLLRLRREKRRAEREDNFDEVALLLGLAERNKMSLEEKLRIDRERQMRLARERLAARKKRMANGTQMAEEAEEKALPDKGDIIGWKESVMKEVERKHRIEQELLISVVMDEGSEELRDAASQMKINEQQTRLQELKTEADDLDIVTKDDIEENRLILDESGAIKTVVRKRILEGSKLNEEITLDYVVTTLLADLQEKQGRESEKIISRLENMNEEEMSRLRFDEIMKRKNQEGRNVLLVFTEYEGIGDEDELLKALDKKYDTLKDKLLMESLRKQAGDAEWAKLSEAERQKRLMRLKLEERRLRKEGKLDELQALLGDNLMAEKNLKALMGENRAKQEEKLRRRLEARRKRIEQGLDPDEDDDGLSEDEDNDSSAPLLDLQKRYDDERDALMARLRGMDNQFLSEKERQAELARLKREQRRAKMEENFESAALVLGLAERHQKAHAERFKNDRARQEKLAKERIEALKRKRKQGVAKEEKEIRVLNNGDRAAMQDSVMQILERKHAQEQEQILILLQKQYTEEEITIAATLREEEREERLQELIRKRQGMDSSLTDEHMQILEEAALLKLTSRKYILTKEKGSEVTDDEIVVTIMADLQQEQDKESETILESLPNKELQVLVELQEKHLTEIKHHKVENVAITLTRIDRSKKTDDGEIVEALEGKYDALKDKILSEALMQQVGEAEWASLSEKERQTRLVKLKLEEKRLRQEGKYDEAAALLGDAIKSQQALELLMGDTKKAQEEKMKKRLELRKKRVAEGMSEAEADKIEKDEILQEEEELQKKKPKNILEELDNRLDDEREALLKRMREGDERWKNEKMRQAELAKLKRQQRMARREDQFEAAALVMGLTAQAEDAEKTKELERKRQMQLAKDRLMQRKKMLKEAQEKVEDKAPVPMPENPDDRVAMEDAVIKEMEIKHATERDLLIMLLQKQDKGQRKSAQTMTEEQRQKRILDLKEQRRQWRDSGPMKEDEAEQLEIFNKTVPYAMEMRIMELKTTNPDATDNEVEVVLLADLQEQQDKESEYLMKDLNAKSVSVLKQLKLVQYLARANAWNDNVARTLLEVKTQLDAISEEELFKAIENKYDALRDKLIIDALMKQMGEEAWAKLSEKERQAKITKLKLQQRILCKKGKYDQALALLGEDIKNQKELASLLGYTKAEQEAIVKKRLERMKELREQREAAGEPVNEEELEQIVLEEEEEEERQKKRNVLQYLEQHFEDEKKALIALLKKKQDQLQNERERQLALAMLRREQRLMREEDNFRTAALIFSLGQLHEKNRRENYLKNQERHKKLARERLRAKRRRKKDTGYSKAELEIKLKQEEEENAKLDASKGMSIEDRRMALHTDVLDEMERKQVNERDTLMQLLKSVSGDTAGIERVKNMSNQEIAEEVEKLREKRQVWREDASLDLESVDYFKLSPDGVGEHFAYIAERQIQQNKILKEAVLLKVEDTRRHLVASKKNKEISNVDEEVPAILLADLQEKQHAEVADVKSILTADADEELLVSLKEDQRKGRREGWMDNLSGGLLGVKARGNAATLTSMTIDIANQEKMLHNMDDELAKEKEAALEGNAKKGSGQIDPAELIAQLERQHDAKKKAMEEQLNRQKALQKQRLEARRKKKDDKDFEAGAAFAMIQGAEETKAIKEEQQLKEKDKQSNLMKERLAARKNARKEAEEKKAMEDRKKQIENDSATNSPTPSSAQSGRRLRRVEILEPIGEISEKKQQEMLNVLKAEHSSQQKKLMRDKEKQAEQLRQKLAGRKKKYENQASQLLSMGERQKTFVEKVKKDELMRQKTIVQDRIQKVRYERTQTMKMISENSKKFQQMKTSDHDKDMERIAKEMEEKFRSSEHAFKSGTKTDSTNVKPVEEDTKEASHQKLGDKERQRLIKEKQAEKRKKKKSVMAAPNMEALSEMLDEKK